MQNITKAIFEYGNLKRVQRTGWWTINIKHPETVAEHISRAIYIGRTLAILEKANPDRVATLLLYHDFPESRINDVHKVGDRYLDRKSAEPKVLKDQISNIPKLLADDYKKAFEEFEDQKTKESIIAKDADLLECAFQAKEYLQYSSEAQDWINRVRARLKTNSAKALIKQMEKTNPNSWWHGFKHTPKR